MNVNYLRLMLECLTLVISLLKSKTYPIVEKNPFEKLENLRKKKKEPVYTFFFNFRYVSKCTSTVSLRCIIGNRATKLY